MLLKTGLGYVVKDGKKIKKFDLPIGNHPDPVGMSFVEVADRAAFDSIVLEKSDEQIEHEKNVEKKNVHKGKAIEKLKTVAGLTDDEVSSLLGG